MDLQELENIDHSRTVELAKRESCNDLSLIDVKKLYPEFCFAGTYGLKDKDVSLSKYLILYEQVLFNVHPVVCATEFEKVYGVKFNEFLILVEAKKILPIICYPYYSFPPFFEQLFKLGPFPRSGRLRTFLEVFGNKAKTSIEDRVKPLVSKKNFELSIDRLFTNYHGSKVEKKELFENSFSSDLYDFELLGMTDLVDVIFEIAEVYPNEAFQITLDYCNCIGRPFFDNAGGINTFTDSTLLKAKQGYLQTKRLQLFSERGCNSQISTRKIESFIGVDPTELVRFLGKSVELNLPSELLDTKTFVNELDNESIIVEMRQQLELIKNSEINSYSINDFERIRVEVCSLLKKDVNRLKLASQWSSDILLLGAILPSLAGQHYFDKSFSSLLYGTVYTTLIGTRYDALKDFSTNMAGNIFDKITKKPMATLYWKSIKT